MQYVLGVDFYTDKHIAVHVQQHDLLLKVIGIDVLTARHCDSAQCSSPAATHSSLALLPSPPPAAM
jgi:hypothetical protein